LQQCVIAAFDSRQPLRQRERRGRGVQAVAPLGIVAPVARAHRGEIGEHDRRRACDRHRERFEARSDLVFSAHDAGLQAALGFGLSHSGFA
jgi:hypothetical protein